MVFRIAFLGELSKDEAQIRRRYEDIPNRSDAGEAGRFVWLFTTSHPVI